MSRMNRFGKLVLLAGVLLVAAAIAGVAQPHLGRGATPSAGTSITVTGNGTVDVTPDRASFDFGVTMRGLTATEALRRNASEARAIVLALRQAGVDASDIQTTQVALWPQTSSDGTEITGYQASNSVRVTAALGKSGRLVDAAVRAGANNVDGPSLDTTDRSSLYDQALEQALGDAKEKAEVIAGSAGLTLGSVQKVQEGGGAPPMPLFDAARTTAESAVPIEPGQQQIQATVSVTYAAR
jgi:uncharacterized protein YggE